MLNFMTKYLQSYLVILALLMLSASSSVHAQHYVRDSTFGKQGVAIPGNVNAANGWNYMRTSQIFPLQDGEMILVSYFLDYNGIEYLKLKANGTRDSSFGSNGYFRYQVPGGLFAFTYGKTAMAANGTLYTLIGAQNAGIAKTTIVCISPSGALDRSFGTNGTQDVQPLQQTFLGGIVIQTDGKLLLGGAYNTNVLGSEFLVARLNANGSYDNSFGTNGVMVSPYSEFIGYSVSSSILAVQNDGKIVFVSWLNGISKGWNYRPIVTVRLKASGSIDSTYATNGYMVYKWDSNFIWPAFITTDALNSIYVGGSLVLNPQSLTEPSEFWQKIFVTKLNSNGTLSTSYGIGGSVLLNKSLYAIGQPRASNAGTSYDPTFVRQQDGVIWATTSSDTGATAHTMIMRIAANGKLDSSFCDSGVLHIRRNYRDVIDCIAQQSDGKILVGGETFLRQGARYYPDSFASICIRIKPSTQAVTGIEGLTTNSSGDAVMVFPNPTTESAAIQLTLQKPQSIIITLVDELGKLVYQSSRIPFSEGEHRYSWSVAQLSSGMYYYNVADANGLRLASGRLVKR